MNDHNGKGIAILGGNRIRWPTNGEEHSVACWIFA